MNKTGRLPYGALTPGDEGVLSKWGKLAGSGSNKPTLAVDLGTFLGRSAAILSRCCSSVHTIDVFEDIHLIKHEASRLHYEDFFLQIPRSHSVVSKSLERFPNIKVFMGLSTDLCKGYDDGTIDLLFFDDDHTFFGLKSEFAHWFQKLKKGKYLIVHDSGPKSHWMEPMLFVKTIGIHMDKVDESDVSTVWRKR